MASSPKNHNRYFNSGGLASYNEAEQKNYQILRLKKEINEHSNKLKNGIYQKENDLKIIQTYTSSSDIEEVRLQEEITKLLGLYDKSLIPMTHIIKIMQDSIKKDVLAGKSHGTNLEVGCEWRLEDFDRACWLSQHTTRSVEVGRLTSSGQIEYLIKWRLRHIDEFARDFTKEDFDKIFDDHIKGALPFRTFINNLMDETIAKRNAKREEEDARRLEALNKRLEEKSKRIKAEAKQDEEKAKLTEDEQRKLRKDKTDNYSEWSPLFYFTLIVFFLLLLLLI